MKKIVLDFETFYSPDFTLKKMTYEEYVRDPRFQALTLGVIDAINPKYNFCLYGPAQIDQWVRGQDWSKIAVIMQNAYFDAFILSDRYNARPAMIMDTMSMARCVHGPLPSASLASLARYYDLPQKSVPYNRFIGKRWEEMDDGLREDLAAGCLDDCALTLEVFKRLARHFPKREYLTTDLSIKAFTDPVFAGDAAHFERLAKAELDAKTEIMNKLCIGESDLQSADKFSRILEACGEEVEMKPGKNGLIPALAKTDQYMVDLSERDDVAGDLARARLLVKSTIRETRSWSMAACASRGPMPVYLGCYAAVTNRWGGGQKLNFQNLPKDRGKKPEDKLGYGVKVPEGKVIVSADYKRVEYQILCALAGQHDMIQKIKDDVDVYCEFGTMLYGREITKKTASERDFSKGTILGSGYGLGKEKFYRMTVAKGYGFERDFTDRAIDLYRETHNEVPRLWRKCDERLEAMACSRPSPNIGPVQFLGGTLLMPWTETRHRFDLVWCMETQGYWRKRSKGNGEPGRPGDNKKDLITKGYTPYWGGGLTEFLCQSLSRVLLCMLIEHMWREHGIRFALLVHDSYSCVVDKKIADLVAQEIVDFCSRPIIWWPDAPPLGAESKISETL